ncbi:hypothetical protein C8Q76DRAFT_694437 [Earliella scabrosa]|nr:hypothetical protein C8Q76DRAFT_694437 [Earliella scabrosa]
MMLPTELCELVIDEVDDKITLHATSLVCKAWLARSRYNLFRVVELLLEAHLDRLLELLTDTPQVAPFIKEIVISENSLIAFFRPPLSIVSRLPNSLSRHPSVKPETLTVHRQMWTPTHYDPDYLSGLSRYSSITSLDLFDVTFDTEAGFSIVLRALRSLRSLSVSSVDCQHTLYPDSLAAVGTVLPLLTTLRVDSSYQTNAINWLLQHNTFPAVKNAEILYALSALIGEDRQGLSPFWESTGSTLEHLTLAISRNIPVVEIDVVQRQLDLSHCTALRTLCLDCREERQIPQHWAWPVVVLSHLPRSGSALRTITLAFQNSSHALVTLQPFAERLDQVLAGMPFIAQLDAVVFQFDFHYPEDRDADLEALLRAFPTLRGMGLLRASSS